jgi:hypothetical protein
VAVLFVNHVEFGNVIPVMFHCNYCYWEGSSIILWLKLPLSHWHKLVILHNEKNILIFGIKLLHRYHKIIIERILILRFY